MNLDRTRKNYLYYNLYLDALVDYSRVDTIKILKIIENKPLTEKLLRYIEESHIKYLEFGFDFNFPIDNLPTCVEHIFFHPNSKFNHPLVNLPSNLKTLIIGDGYWQTMDYLPSSLLFLGYHKSKMQFINKYRETVIPLDTLINTSLPNLIYITVPCDITKYIDLTSSLYTKKKMKISSQLNTEFIDFINNDYTIDYFMVHG